MKAQYECDHCGLYVPADMVEVRVAAFAFERGSGLAHALVCPARVACGTCQRPMFRKVVGR